MASTPAVVALVIADLAKGGWRNERPRKVATIERRLATINARHERQAKYLAAGQTYPEVSLVMEGVRRSLGMSQVGKLKLPLTFKMIDKPPAAKVSGPVAAARDEAPLLVGFEGALRRSELAAVRSEDMSWHSNGLTIRIRRSKSGQARARQGS